MTEFDMEIIRLLLAGNDARTIARMLGKKSYTIQNRITHLARKLKVNGRTLIAAYVIIHEIISLDEARALLAERTPDPDPY